MKLQLALDDISLDGALDLLSFVADSLDIVEVGTPLIIEEGLHAVRAIKERFPNLPILADVKIMDAGEYEARSAFIAGAKYVTVLGVTDLLTVKACLEVATKFDGAIVVDMICVEDLASKIAQLESIGVRALAVHTGVDQQAAGRTPAGDLAIMKRHSERCEIFVAGGINSKNIREYMKLGADVAIVGGGVCHAADPVKEAQMLSKVARELA